MALVNVTKLGVAVALVCIVIKSIVVVTVVEWLDSETTEVMRKVNNPKMAAIAMITKASFAGFVVRTPRNFSGVHPIVQQVESRW